MPPCEVAVKPFLEGAATTQQLGTALSADFEALQNDFEQATEMAAEFQRQLSGKSNEFAELKHLFEKTTNDFSRLQTDLTALRDERHRLANEVMLIPALEYELQTALQQVEKLKKEIAALDVASGEKTRIYEQRVAHLAAEREALRHSGPAPDTLPQSATDPTSKQTAGPDVVSVLSELVKTVDQLRKSMEKNLTPKPRSSTTRAAVPSAPAGDDFIAISFSEQS